MSKVEGFAPGRVFVIPLLGGGFAFGYATALYNASMFANVFDYISEIDSPPSALEKHPIALYDVQIGADFTISDPARGGESWRWCDTTIPGPVAPRNRYVQMGLPPRRIDVLQEEPDQPLTPAQAEHVPHLGSRFPPYSAALVEVKLRRLEGTPKDLIAAWRDRSPKESRTARSAQASTTTGASKPNAVHIEIRLRSKGLPTPSDLKLRHQLETRIAKQKLGTITDAGGGLGVMEITIQTDATDAVERIRAVLEELGVPKARAKVTPVMR